MAIDTVPYIYQAIEGDDLVFTEDMKNTSLKEIKNGRADQRKRLNNFVSKVMSVSERGRRWEDLAMDNHENEHGIETVALQIEGMECGCEATLIDRKMRALAGVRSHEVNPITHQLRVSYDPASATIQDIIRSVSETGMKASLEKSQGPRSTWWREKQQLALYGCGLLALIAFVSGKLGASPLVANGLYVLSVLTGVYYPARKALIALVNLTPTIHLLMLIGSGGAMALGLWGESAVLIFVYSLGDVLESYAVDKARGALRSLTELMPREALVRTETGETVRPIEQVAVGDVVVVRPGERIPVDGRVVRGSSYVDQAAVTGEPIPVLRETGGEVFAGTINQNGSLEVEVEKAASETMLSKIIYSVEEAQAKKGKLQRFSDAFGVYYTPGHVRPRRACSHSAAPVRGSRMAALYLPGARGLRGLLLLRPCPLRPRGYRRRHGKGRPPGDGLQGRRLPGARGPRKGYCLRQNGHAHHRTSPGDGRAPLKRLKRAGGARACRHDRIPFRPSIGCRNRSEREGGRRLLRAVLGKLSGECRTWRDGHGPRADLRGRAAHGATWNRGYRSPRPKRRSRVWRTRGRRWYSSAPTDIWPAFLQLPTH